MFILANNSKTTSRAKLKPEASSKYQESDEELVEEMEVEASWRGKVARAQKIFEGTCKLNFKNNLIINGLNL